MPNRYEHSAKTIVIVLSLFSVLLLHVGIYAQTPAAPSIPHRGGHSAIVDNFTPEQYGLGRQNWCVLQSKSGFIYVGNTEGLLEYDGKKWRAYTIPGNSVRSFTEDKKGRLFIGGTGRIGYMQRNPSGDLSYASILEESDIGHVYSTHSLGDTIYFHPQFSIFQWANDSLSTIVADSSLLSDKRRTQLYPALKVNNSILIRKNKVEILELTSKGLKPESILTFQNSEKVASILPYDSQRLLLAIKKKGLFLYDGSTLQPTLPEASRIIRDLSISTSFILFDSTFAYATRQQGLIIVDRMNGIQQIINKESGLLQNKSLYATSDREGNIWLAQEGGVSKIQHSLPMTKWTTEDGIEGIIMALRRFNGKMYTATTLGIYEEQDRSELQPKPTFRNILTNTASWDFLLINGRLLIATTNGLFFKNKSTAPPLLLAGSPNGPLYIFERSKQDTNRVYVAGRNDLYSITFKDNSSSIDVQLLTRLNKRIYSMREDASGRLWMGTTAGLYSIDPGNRTSSDRTSVRNSTQHNIPTIEADRNVNIITVDDTLLFISRVGMYRFNEKTNQFMSAADFDDVSKQLTAPIFRLQQAPDKQIWFMANKKAYLAERNDKGNFSFLKTPLPAIKLPQTNALYLEQEAIWYGTNFGLYRHDLKQKRFDYPTPRVAIRQLNVIEGDTLLSGTLANPPDSIYTIPYEQNSLRFEVASSSYIGNIEPEFQYRVHQDFGTWSQWTTETVRDYTYLKEATYHFDVRTRNALGKVSKIRSYHFHILPPWYRSIWAYLFYASLAVAAAYGFSILGRNRGIAKAQKEYLEKEIKSAEEAQRALIPKLYPGLEGFSVAGYFAPAADVGGDHYDYIVLNGGKNHLLTLADVEGKRMSGALPATLLNGLLNGVIFSDQPPSLKQIAIEIDRLFYQKLDGKRVTTILIMLSKDSDRIEFLNAGCYPPLKLTAGNIEFIKVAGQNNGPLGNGISTRNLSKGKNIFTQEIQLEVGSFLILYSDGLRSIKGKSGVPYFRALIGELENCEPSADPTDVLNIILEGIEKHGHGMQQQDDDITMMVIKRIAIA